MTAPHPALSQRERVTKPKDKDTGSSIKNVEDDRKRGRNGEWSFKAGACYKGGLREFLSRIGGVYGVGVCVCGRCF